MGNLVSELRHFYLDLNTTLTSNLTSLSLYAGLVFGLFILYQWICKPLMSPLGKIPGLPFINPFLGSMGEAMTGEAMDSSINWVERYGSLVRYYFFFGSPRLLVADPKIMKQILVTNAKNYAKPQARMAFMKAVLGAKSLLITEGQEHTLQRKIMNPYFGHGSTKKMVVTTQKYVDKLVEKWMKAVPNGGTEDLALTDELQSVTLDVIGDCGFGYKFDSIHEPEKAVNRAFQRMLTGFSLSWRFALPFYNKLPFKEVRNSRAELKLMQTTITDVIQRKHKLLQDKPESAVDDMLGMLMLAKDPDTGIGISDSELRDHIITFLLAGHETTSIALSWCLMALSQHPDIQERARQEVASVMPSPGEPIKWEDLERLNYLTCVIKETLRLYPPAPMTLRMNVNEDYFYKYKIPAGTVMLLHMGAMHRNPEYWPNPLMFKPERFMENDHDMYMFLPFLMGSRMCIGYRFALMEMKVVLSQLLRNFKFDHIPGTYFKRKQAITMRLDPPLKLKVSKVVED